MFIVFKKKKIIVTLSVLIIVVCCFLIAKFNPETKPSLAENTYNSSSQTDLLPGEAVAVFNEDNNYYFLKAKNDRDTIRSKAIELLQGIMENDKASPEAKKEAEDSIIRIADEMNKEVKTEALLSAKGYKDCVVFVSDGTTTVTLKSDKLIEEDAAKINDIVLEISGNNNIKIVEVN